MLGSSSVAAAARPAAGFPGAAAAATHRKSASSSFRGFAGCRNLFMESPVATKARTSTLYDVLGVQRQSDIKDIKSAYRHLARQSHPDVVPVEHKEESTKDFLRIHAAYTTLSDPEARARYDLQLSLQSLPRYTIIRESGDAFAFTSYTGSSPGYSPSASSSPPPPPPFSPSSRGRTWETDQCW